MEGMQEYGRNDGRTDMEEQDTRTTTNKQFRRNARWAAQGTQKAVAESRKAAAASA
jgi:hypothetical protein